MRRLRLRGDRAGELAAAGVYLASLPKTAPGEWVYSTMGAAGQSVTLEDGSQLYMMSGSKLRARFPKESRDVQLLGGDVLFNLRRAPNRPFRVYVDGGRIQAVGTQFRVHRTLDQTLVNVLEGIVQVSGEDAREPAIQVAAGGHATVFLDGRVMRGDARAANSATVLPKTSSESLIFRGSTLAEVAEAYNGLRFSGPRLLIDEGARSQTLWAIIPATDPELLIRILGHQPELELSPHDGAIVVRLRESTDSDSEKASSP